MDTSLRVRRRHRLWPEALQREIVAASPAPWAPSRESCRAPAAPGPCPAASRAPVRQAWQRMPPEPLSSAAASRDIFGLATCPDRLSRPPRAPQVHSGQITRDHAARHARWALDARWPSLAGCAQWMQQPGANADRRVATEAPPLTSATGFPPMSMIAENGAAPLLAPAR